MQCRCKFCEPSTNPSKNFVQVNEKLQRELEANNLIRSSKEKHRDENI